jgi:hypothetical protein
MKKIYTIIICGLGITATLPAIETSAQCMKGNIVQTMAYSVAPFQTLNIMGVAYGPSITVWSGGWVKGSSDTAIIAYVNGRADGWCDNWPTFNGGVQNLRIFPMFPVEASFFGQASGGMTGSQIMLVATCVPDGASFAVFMSTPGNNLPTAEEILNLIDIPTFVKPPTRSESGFNFPKNETQTLAGKKEMQELYLQAAAKVKHFKEIQPDADIRVMFMGKNPHILNASELLIGAETQQTENVENPHTDAKGYTRTTTEEPVAKTTSEPTISNGKNDTGSYRKFKKVRHGWKQVKWPNSARNPRNPPSGVEKTTAAPGSPTRKSQSRGSLATSPAETQNIFTEEQKYQFYKKVEDSEYELLEEIKDYEPYEIMEIVAIRDNRRQPSNWDNSDWYKTWYGHSWRPRTSATYMKQAKKAAKFSQAEIVYTSYYGKPINPKSLILAENILVTNNTDFKKMEECISYILELQRSNTYKNNNRSRINRTLTVATESYQKAKQLFPTAELHEYQSILQNILR